MPDSALLSPEMPAGPLERWLGRWLALPGLVLLSFGALYEVNPGNVGLALLLLATALAAPLFRLPLWREPLVWLTVVFVTWVLLAGWSGARAHPDWAYEIWTKTGDWLLTPFLGTLVTAFWLARFPRLFGVLLLLLVAGYLARVLAGLDPAIFDAMLAWRGRWTFEDSADNFGLWSLVCVIVLLGFVWTLLRIRPLWGRVLGWVLWSAAFALAVAGIVFSQTRGAWLAAPFALVVMVYGFLVEHYWRLSRNRISGASIAIACVVVFMLALLTTDVAVKRLAHERETVVDVLSGQLDDLPDSSIGFRIRMWGEGLRTWAGNPVVGGGPGTPELALATSDDAGIRRFEHFHNLYVDVLASLGVAGILLLGTLLYIATHSAHAAVRSGWMSRRTGNVLLAVGVAFAITQLFTSGLHSNRGPFVVALLLGMACAWRFVPDRAEGRQRGATADGSRDAPRRERLRRRLLHEDRQHWRVPLLWWQGGREARRCRDALAQLECYAMFIGNPRSGHSLLGSLLNAHPDAVIAHELNVLRYLQWGFSRERILGLLLRRDREFGDLDRHWSGYDYRVPGLSQGSWRCLRVIGDKRGAASTRRLHRHPELLDRLRSVIDLPLKVFHSVRNPYDNIARMALVNGSGLSNATERYFRNTAWAIETTGRLQPAELMHVYHERMIAQPKETLSAMLGHLGIVADPGYLELASARIITSPRRSRDQVEWSPPLIEEVERRIHQYPHLRGYGFES